jgi:hypothetical protein
MSSVRKIAVAALLLASRLAAQQPYKFSTTVYGTPLDSFGTTVAANSGFRGDIYDLKPGTRRLPDFSKLKPIGAIYTPYLCVPPRSFDEGFPGVTERFEWFAIDYNGRFWVSTPGRYRFTLASDDGSILYIDGHKVIQNDHQHPVIEKATSVKLKAGAHAIRVSSSRDRVFMSRSFCKWRVRTMTSSTSSTPTSSSLPPTRPGNSTFR